MARYGYIQDKLDIKFLVLYLTARTEGPIDLATLTDLTMCDEGVDYFLFAQALAELVESEHLRLEDGLYAITEKGRRNGAAWEDDLPYSIRKKCDRALLRVNDRLRRQNQIRAQVIPRSEEGFTVRMVLDDSQGNLMTLELYSPTQAQGEALTASFLAGPERLYRTLLTSLQEGGEQQNRS